MSDEERIRTVKKISRAGSGGYSIYLPKKWINRWTEGQQKEKEVEIFEVGDQLVLSPKRGRRELKKEMEGISRDELIYQALSAYINGIDDFCISQKGLSDIDVSEMRNIMRFLDENLFLQSEGDTVCYHNQAIVTHDADSLLSLLFDKVIEAERLAADIINDCDSNPNHTIHLMRMMYAIEKEDVNRLSLQLFRNLSRFKSSARSFLDINFRWNSANMLEIIGDALFAIVQNICYCYGIEVDELQYPMGYLEKKAENRSSVMAGAEKFRLQLVIDMREAAMMLSKAKEAIILGDGRGAFEYKDEIRKQVRAMEEELADSVSDFSATCGNQESSFLPVLLIAIRAREVMYLTKSLTKRAALIYFLD